MWPNVRKIQGFSLHLKKNIQNYSQRYNRYSSNEKIIENIFFYYAIIILKFYSKILKIFPQMILSKWIEQ